MDAVDEALWARVGGGFELVPGGDRHGPADPEFPPPGGPWEPLELDGRLVGWATLAGRPLARRALAEGARIGLERRSQLLARLGHKLRSSVLALQETARQAAFGRVETLEQLYEQAQEVGRRASALEVAALEPKDQARAIVVGAVLNLAAPFADYELPADAVVRSREPVLVEALTRAYEWMGGPGTTITGERLGAWWRLDFGAAPEPSPLWLPEAGEPLVRLLVDTQLDGWLDSSGRTRAAIYLPSA